MFIYTKRRNGASLEEWEREIERGPNKKQTALKQKQNGFPWLSSKSSHKSPRGKTDAHTELFTHTPMVRSGEDHTSLTLQTYFWPRTVHVNSRVQRYNRILNRSPLYLCIYELLEAMKGRHLLLLAGQVFI